MSGRWFVGQNLKGFEDANKDVYLFGIYSGDSMCQTGNFIRGNNVAHNKFYGFDSFEGLPKEDYKENNDAGIHQDWFEGNFDSRQLMPNVADIPNFLADRFKNETTYEIEMVKGFFSESLTDELVKTKQMKPALLIDIDTDLYISAYQALDWMAKNNLIKNTMIYFDDWSYPEVEYSGGESLAFKEICEKYGYKYQQIYFSKFDPVFMVNI